MIFVSRRGRIVDIDAVAAAGELRECAVWSGHHTTDLIFQKCVGELYQFLGCSVYFTQQPASASRQRILHKNE